MAIVRYAEYRRLEAKRRDANNAMMALLAGSKLAVNTLGLTAGSELTLSRIFPQVPHIQRFNLRADDARALLDDAEHHLATMAVPYVLALHEDYVLHCADFLVANMLMSKTTRKAMSAKTMHQRVATCAKATFSSPSLELFDLVRSLRNSQIHVGGLVNDECHDARRAMSPQADSLWLHLTKEPVPPCLPGDPVQLGQAQLVGTLAVTNQLMEEANGMLQSIVPTAEWAKIAVADAVSAVELRGNPEQRLRRILGFVRRYYSPVAIPDALVKTEATAAGAI